VRIRAAGDVSWFHRDGSIFIDFSNQVCVRFLTVLSISLYIYNVQKTKNDTATANNVGEKMKTVYDVQQLLKKFGTIIYVGDRLADLELMEEELKELYQSQLIDVKEYQMALLIVRHEAQFEREKRMRKG
jgi:uncharacterized protein YqgQ